MNFGRLVAVRDLPERAGSGAMWLCKCACGNEISVLGYSLRRGDTQSCGCLIRDMNRDRTTHGACVNEERTQEYITWRAMVSRCHNSLSKDYQDYGAKGIEVCGEWRASFGAFLAHIGRRPSRDHSIDRFPNGDGNYEPGNVRWATKKEQARNRKNNKYIEFQGRQMLLVEVCEITGVPAKLVRDRLYAGWSTAAALTFPKIKRKFANKPRN